MERLSKNFADYEVVSKAIYDECQARNLLPKWFVDYRTIITAQFIRDRFGKKI